MYNEELASLKDELENTQYEIDQLTNYRNETNVKILDLHKHVSGLKKQIKAKEKSTDLPERHGTAWEKFEWDSLRRNLDNLIENRMRVHKRTKIAIVCAIKTLLKEYK